MFQRNEKTIEEASKSKTKNTLTHKTKVNMVRTTIKQNKNIIN